MSLKTGFHPIYIFNQSLKWPAWIRYLIAFALTASCSVLRMSIDPVLGNGAVFTPFYLGVVITAYLCGTGPAIFATLLGLITTDFRFLPPRGHFKADHSSLVAESFFLMVCSAIVGTFHALRRAQSKLETESMEVRRRAEAAEKAEAALRESENRKSAILMAALDAIITMDHHGKVVDFNPAAERIFGYRRQDVVGQPLAELIIPVSLRQRHYDGLAKYLATGVGPMLNKRIELSALRANGEEFPVELSINRISDQEPPMFTATLRDITKRKQAVDALREGEERYRSLVEAIAQIVWTNSPEGKMKGEQKDWGEFTGQTQAEYQDYGWVNAVHPEDGPKTVEAWKEAVAGKRLFIWEHRVRRRDGVYRNFSIRGAPVLREDGSIREWVGIHTDITERKQAEVALDEAQEELRQHAAVLEHAVDERTEQLREKVGELEAFSYSVSHDMRQPLRAMRNYAQLLLEDYGENLQKEPRQFLERIMMSADRLDRLIQDLLTYSRVTRGEHQLSAINIGELVRQVVAMYPDLHNAEIEIVPSSAMVRANDVALTQCISNLLANAVKFVPKGKVPKVKVLTESRDGQVRLWVQDNGIGIAEKDRERIFEIFKRGQSSENYEGTGIGLSIVKKAIEKMGGKVGVESEVGEGSRFWLELQKA